MAEPKKYKLLWISDSPRLHYIGQSVVGREILSLLDRDIWDIGVVGFGDDNIRDPLPFDFKIHNVSREDMGKLDVMWTVLENTKPDIVVMSHDIFIWPIVHQIKERFPNIKLVGYITVDGIPIFSGWKHLFYAYDLIITPTKWGRQELLNQWLDLDVQAIPYGVHHNVFKPPAVDRAEFKKTIDKQSKDSPYNRPFKVADKFVGIYYGANQTRKNLGAIYEGWKRFAVDKPDVTFFLITHSAILGNVYAGSYVLSSFMDARGMEIFPSEIPLHHLVRFLGMSDVLLHPTMAEGFGLSVLEAMACGTVPITTSFSGHTDFCNPETAYMLDWTPLIGKYNLMQAVASIDSVVSQLEHAYADWQSGAIEQKRLAAMAIASSYSWTRTASMMSKALKDVMERQEQRLVVKHIV